jgi:hypothetical protein
VLKRISCPTSWDDFTFYLNVCGIFVAASMEVVETLPYYNPTRLSKAEIYINAWFS